MEYYQLRFAVVHPLQPRSFSDGGSMLRSPNAASLLHGLSLSEAFHKYVLNDPEVVSLADAVMRLGHEYESIFREGQFPGPYVKFTWPLDIAAGDLAFQFVRPLDLGGSLPEAPDAVEKVCAVIVDRLKALRELLISGKVVARGTFAKTGEIKTVDRLQWARREPLVDVQNSDLLETENHKPVLKWSGLTLEARTAQLDSDQKSSEKAAKISSNRKPTAQRASIDAAVHANWPNGIPPGISVQKRDQVINELWRTPSLLISLSMD